MSSKGNRFFLCFCCRRSTKILDSPTTDKSDKHGERSKRLADKTKEKYLSKCKTILDFSSEPVGDKGMKAVSVILSADTMLTSLNLYNNQLTDRGLQKLSFGLESNKNLQIMNLNTNKITDGGLSALLHALNGKKQFTSLNLGSNAISNAGAIAIGRYLQSKNCRLKKLNLEANQIGDAGASEIAVGVKSNKFLEQLNMESNQITDEGILEVTESFVQQTLKLDVPGIRREVSLFRGNCGSDEGQKMAQQKSNKKVVFIE